MTRIESDSVTIPAPAAHAFAYLTNLNNLQELMPADKISNWESTDSTCRFTINGMASIGMKLGSCVPPNTIVLDADGKNPFAFTLTISWVDNGDSCTGNMAFDAALNPMLKMMAVTPLRNFLNILSKNLVARMANQ